MNLFRIVLICCLKLTVQFIILNKYVEPIIALQQSYFLFYIIPGFQQKRPEPDQSWGREVWPQLSRSPVWNRHGREATWHCCHSNQNWLQIAWTDYKTCSCGCCESIVRSFVIDDIGEIVVCYWRKTKLLVALSWLCLIMESTDCTFWPSSLQPC